MSAIIHSPHKIASEWRKHRAFSEATLEHLLVWRLARHGWRLTRQETIKGLGGEEVGRADVVGRTRNAIHVYEVKKRLDRASIYAAVGQVTAYSGALEMADSLGRECRRYVVGVSHRDVRTLAPTYSQAGTGIEILPVTPSMYGWLVESYLTSQGLGLVEADTEPVKQTQPLSQWLEENGWNQSALARRLGVTRKSVSNWVHKRCRVDARNALAIETLTGGVVTARSLAFAPERHG